MNYRAARNVYVFVFIFGMRLDRIVLADVCIGVIKTNTDTMIPRYVVFSS